MFSLRIDTEATNAILKAEWTRTIKKTTPALFILMTLFLVSCSATRKNLDMAGPYEGKVQWPKRYAADRTRFFVHSELDLSVPPERAWEVLVYAEKWPSFYEGAQNVEVLGSDDGRLTEGATFVWKSMGAYLESEVIVLEMPMQLCWESSKTGVKRYSAWLIVPTPSGCRLILQESRYGAMTSLQKLFLPKRLSRMHGIWLEDLRQQAEWE